MGTGKQLFDKIKSVDIRDAIVETLEDTKETALDLQAQQLFEGKRSTGGNIKPFYSPLTVSIKKEKHQVSDRVTLRDTGDFYKSLYFVAKPQSFEFKSTDPKRFKLVDKYGEWIFGLSEKFRRIYVQEALKFHFIRNIKKQLGN